MEEFCWLKWNYSSVSFTASSSAIPSHLIKKKLVNASFNFIWKNKSHYVNKNDLGRNYEDGGSNVTDLEIMNGAHYSVVEIIETVHYLVFSVWETGRYGIFVEVCFWNFKAAFEMIQLPSAVCWKLAYSPNFSPHKTSIWNNCFIAHRNKSLFYEKWFILWLIW